MDAQVTIQSLDEASARLNRTLDTLRETVLDKAFRPDVASEKRLFDFVDEAGVNDLYDSIKHSMDRFESIRRTLLDACAAFDRDLAHIRATLEPPDAVAAANATAAAPPDTPAESPVPALFYALEAHATEVASSLEGLVKHYDLCVTALKHTEGGGEAISKASQGEADRHHAHNTAQLADLGYMQLAQVGGEGDGDDDDESGAGGGAGALGERDRADLLTVLTKDAGEVEDVVQEISDRLADMEEQLARIHGYVGALRTRAGRMRRGVRLMRETAGRIPAWMGVCEEFRREWAEEKGVVGGRLEELRDLEEFYLGFAEAYDGLVVEVDRRRRVRKEMERVVRHAMRDIDKLYKCEWDGAPVSFLSDIAFTLFTFGWILKGWCADNSQPTWNSEKNLKPTKENTSQVTFGPGSRILPSGTASLRRTTAGTRFCQSCMPTRWAMPCGGSKIEKQLHPGSRLDRSQKSDVCEI